MRVINLPSSKTLRASFMLGALTVCVGVLAFAAVAFGSAGSSEISLQRISSLAYAMRGELTEAAFNRAFVRMDPAARSLADRFTPLPRVTLANFTPTEGLGAAAPGFADDTFANLSADAARVINEGIPMSSEKSPAARPFKLVAGGEDRERAVQCLTEAVYYEAAFEPLEGRRAVAQVVLNRLRHPIYPKTVCDVVYQGSTRPTGCQFTFTCDGALAHPPVAQAWLEARRVAELALGGYVAKEVGEATHYHADYVVPRWAPTLSKVAKLGAHIFYRWPGGMGAPAAFSGRYAGDEPLVGGLAQASAKAGGIVVQAASAPALVIADAGPVMNLAPPIALAQDELHTPGAPVALKVPAVKHSPHYALGAPCANSTLGNCMNF
jgi:hypothetical protein